MFTRFVVAHLVVLELELTTGCVVVCVSVVLPRDFMDGRTVNLVQRLSEPCTHETRPLSGVPWREPQPIVQHGPVALDLEQNRSGAQRLARPLLHASSADHSAPSSRASGKYPRAAAHSDQSRNASASQHEHGPLQPHEHVNVSQ